MIEPDLRRPQVDELLPSTPALDEESPFATMMSLFDEAGDVGHIIHVLLEIVAARVRGVPKFLIVRVGSAIRSDQHDPSLLGLYVQPEVEILEICIGREAVQQNNERHGLLGGSTQRQIVFSRTIAPQHLWSRGFGYIRGRTFIGSNQARIGGCIHR